MFVDDHVKGTYIKPLSHACAGSPARMSPHTPKGPRE
jgi:hypothetical protein